MTALWAIEAVVDMGSLKGKVVCCCCWCKKGPLGGSANRQDGRLGGPEVRNQSGRCKPLTSSTWGKEVREEEDLMTQERDIVEMEEFVLLWPCLDRRASRAQGHKQKPPDFPLTHLQARKALLTRWGTCPRL